MAQTELQAKAGYPFYANGLEHLNAELELLDLLIKRRIILFRATQQQSNSDHNNKHLYISSEEIDEILHDDSSGLYTDYLQAVDKAIEACSDEIRIAIDNSYAQEIILPLPQLVRLFSLSVFEMHAIIVCLGPELYRKYDRLYAYLQDDITRKCPSVDLVLDLFCFDKYERWQHRAVFTKSSNLFLMGLLKYREDLSNPSGSSGLGQFITLEPRILSYLLNNNSIDSRLQYILRPTSITESISEITVSRAAKHRLNILIDRHIRTETAERENLVILLHGPQGVGKNELAKAVCHELGCLLLQLDLEFVLGQGSDAENILMLAFREGLLLQAPLYFRGIDSVLDDTVNGRMIRKLLNQMLLEFGWLTFFEGSGAWQPEHIFEHVRFESIHVPMPDEELRTTVWLKNLSAHHIETDHNMINILARQFKLTPRQISHAAMTAKSEFENDDPNENPGYAEISRACRYQSGQRLKGLTVHIRPMYQWEDIVLPESRKIMLREITNQVKHKYRVFTEWGFDNKLAYGKGLSALFSGSPGTGKTMAAQIIANELGLDIYKIDISSVVSKYIGETEKNLSRIFQEAENSNAILFFDEADALFGKRTDVSDAHDRYANIEVSYLLQRMEEYDGVVILATNLRDNMDDAFVRRIRFIVEFPFPDMENRLKIWKGHFPAEAPLESDIDYDYLARRFKISGGNIKNIVLNAAFLSAEKDKPIGMSQLIDSIRREYEKIGKIWDEKYSYEYMSKQ